MRQRLLVLSTVHQPDDPRIREKLIRTLSSEWEVSFATKTPGPSNLDGIDWVALPGSRRRRWWAALRQGLARPADVVVVHDPELLPVAMVVRTVRRIPVVFDLHENLPAQLATRGASATWARRLQSLAAGWALRAAEQALTVTMAEDGYRPLFRRDHPVFPNYPVPGTLPEPAPSDGSVVYVGDVTEARGALVLVEAVARLRPTPQLILVGRFRDDLGVRLRAMGAGLGVDVLLTGWLAHPEAMQMASRAGVAVSPLLDLPNYRRSLPTKVLEYLEMGVPVVASDLPGTRELAAGLPGLELVAPGDAAALAAALRRALADPARRMAAEGNTGVLKESFAWPDAAVRAFYAGLRRG